MHYLVYSSVSRVFSYTLPHVPYILSALSVLYIFANIAVRKASGVFVDGLYFVASAWIGYVFLLFSSVVLYELIHLTLRRDSRLVLALFLTSAFLLATYALIQGSIITTRTYTIPLQNLREPLRIVHLSDIHVGTVHQEKYLTEIVEKTNSENPDIVLITGDLFDGSAKIDITMLEPLNNLTARTFFSHGNHELYEGLEEVRNTLEDHKLELLENTAVSYKGVQIVGVNDRQALRENETLASVLEGIQESGNEPRLLMYHTPSDWSVARDNGVSIMFSGHTHNGQVFPFTLLVRLFFHYINGLYQEDGAYLHVSPGSGTWGPPMRLGSQNQITVFNLIPNSN